MIQPPGEPREQRLGEVRPTKKIFPRYHIKKIKEN